MKPTRVQNKLFQIASLLMCYCSIEIGQFQILTTQSRSHAIELSFKVQISPDQPMSNTNERGIFTSIPILGNLQVTVLSIEFPITIFLPFLFQTNGNFYQIILSHTLGRCPNKSMIKNLCHKR